MDIAVPHLTRIGRTYYFRQTVPPDLRLVLGKREIKRSLRTGNRTTATLLCCQLSTRMAAVVEETRANEADLARLPQKDREAIRRIVDEIFRDELERDEEWRAAAHAVKEGGTKRARWVPEDGQRMTSRLTG